MAKMNRIKYDYYEIPKTEEIPPEVTVAFLRRGFGEKNPKYYMDNAVIDYLEKKGNPMYNEFIEIFLDNPYLRVVVTGINEMPFKSSNKL